MRMPRRAGTYDATVATRAGPAPWPRTSRVERFDFEQQSLEQPREQPRRDQAGATPTSDEPERLADDETETPTAAVAPSAMRTPISCVRSRTEYAITP